MLYYRSSIRNPDPTQTQSNNTLFTIDLIFLPRNRQRRALVCGISYETSRSGDRSKQIRRKLARSSNQSTQSSIQDTEEEERSTTTAIERGGGGGDEEKMVESSSSSSSLLPPLSPSFSLLHEAARYGRPIYRTASRSTHSV